MGLLNRLFGPHTRAVWRTETWLMHKLGYVRPPEAVQRISTGVCDLHCPHCYAQAGKESPGELTTDEALPLCHRLLREELLRAPDAPGAAKMRLALALFDDAVIVTLPSQGPEKPAGPQVRKGRPFSNVPSRLTRPASTRASTRAVDGSSNTSPGIGGYC